jgi:hypothetical protein
MTSPPPTLPGEPEGIGRTRAVPGDANDHYDKFIALRAVDREGGALVRDQ